MPTQFSSSASTVRGLTRAALCTACACLLAPVSIPIGPVSLTLGVFAILLAGALLPPALAALSACAYLLLGAGTPQEDPRYGKPMHNEAVVFNEDILPTGAALHTLFALRMLAQET